LQPKIEGPNQWPQDRIPAAATISADEAPTYLMVCSVAMFRPFANGR